MRSTKERRGLRCSVELFVVAVILGVLVILLVPTVQNVRLPDGPPGEMIPTLAPDEKRRVDHASGISIVLPENWDTRNFDDAELENLFIYARGFPGRRLKSLITIALVANIPSLDLTAFTATTFQGLPAYERMVVERADTFDDPARSRFTMYFQHDDQWWRLDYCLASECKVLPEMVRTYINTIRWHAKASEKEA
jgi:hypothetical protein